MVGGIVIVFQGRLWSWGRLPAGNSGLLSDAFGRFAVTIGIGLEAEGVPGPILIIARDQNSEGVVMVHVLCWTDN